MTEWIANSMEWLLDFSNILNASIAASWMVLAVIVLRLVLKKAPRWFHVALWGLVAVRLLLPFSIESTFSLIPSTETIPQDILRVEGTQLQQPAHFDVVSNPVFSGGATVEVGQTIDRVQVQMVKMSFIWLAGIAILLIYTAVSYWRLRRRVSEAVILRDNIFQSENVASPFVLGIIKPRIYLPYKMGEQDLAHVVAHEQAHIRRRDHWWKPLGFLLLSAYWFNPLLWLAYALLCRDIEMACDERAVRGMGAEELRAYCAVLLACSVPRHAGAACPLAFGEVGVKTRIRRMLQYKKPALWVTAAAVVVCLAAAVCFLTDPKPSAKNLPEPFGQVCAVSEVIYDAPVYGSTLTEETFPTLRLTKDAAGQPTLTVTDFTGYVYPAIPLTEERLTRAGFDRLFVEAEDGTGGWRGGRNAAALRRRNAAAWTGVMPDATDGVPNWYHLLQQEDGTLYLAMGYRFGPDAPDSIRWLLSLRAPDGPVDFAGEYVGAGGSLLVITRNADGGYAVELDLPGLADLENAAGVYDEALAALHFSGTDDSGGALAADVTAAGEHLRVTLTQSSHPDCPAGTALDFYDSDVGMPWRVWSEQELLAAFAAQAEAGAQAVACVDTPDAAAGLVGVVLFTRPDDRSASAHTWLMFLDKDGVGQVCGLAAAPADDPAFTYCGGGTVSFRLQREDATAYGVRVTFSHDGPASTNFKAEATDE